MIIEADASGLEVVCAGYLSKDPVLCNEIINGVDIHEENRKAFELPTRLVAKTFKFRIIYGGSKWSFAKDPEFNWISSKPEFWDEVITNYYNKYKGLKNWHNLLMYEVERSGRWTSPTGRCYTYNQVVKKNGTKEWPRTTILNYPVQGLGADLMSIARVSAFRRLRNRPDTFFINTVHDSIMIDTKGVDDELIRTITAVFQDIPRNFEKVFGSKFDLPMKCKIKVGPNWKDMKEID